MHKPILIHIFSVVFSCVVASASAQSAPLQWVQGDPTADEQNAMECINRMRANPVGELTRILTLAPLDASIAAILRPYENTLPDGSQETPAQAAARLIPVVAQNLKNPGYSTEPLVFYPFFQQRAAFQKDNLLTFAINTQHWTTYDLVFNPVYAGTEQPPSYLFPPVFLQDNAYSEGDTGESLASVAGPNATGGSVTFGPHGGNYTLVSWTDLSIEGGLSFEQWSAFSMLSNAFLVLDQGLELPNLTLGHARLAGVDYSERTEAPGAGSHILTIDIGDAQFFTSGDDLPFGPVSTVFITGVVYRDSNSNGIYDSGEGIPAIKIATDTGGYFALTSASGGYAIPVPANSGSITVTAAGTEINRAKVIVVGDQSIKVDFALPASLPPGSGTMHMANISSRAFVGTGANILIAGFVITGSGMEQVLIRGIGPALAAFGVGGALAQPQINLFDASGNMIASNTGWETSLYADRIKTAAAQVGAFALPGGSADCALLLDLSPGAYTVQVSGLNGTTGNGMVEVYEVAPASG